MTRATLILRAYIELIAHDLFMSQHNFESLHQRIRNFPVRHVGSNTSTREDVTLALNVACCFYPKRVLCLQRSAFRGTCMGRSWRGHHQRSPGFA